MILDGQRVFNSEKKLFSYNDLKKKNQNFMILYGQGVLNFVRKKNL